LSDKLKIYWNNICLLRKKEEEFLNTYFESNKECTFDIEYFGLGMPKKLKKQVKDDLVTYKDFNADVIVSTELDIFWDKKILGNLTNLQSLKGLYDISDILSNNTFIDPNNYLTISQALPMLITINPIALKDLNKPTSLLDLTKPIYKGKIVLGGSDTAAGRIIVSSIWYLYGEEVAMKFLDNVTFVNIPAMGLNMVKKGVYPIAILPSVLCGRELITICPKEGSPSIPTYCCIHKNANLKQAKKFLDVLFGSEMQEFYALRGYMIPSNKAVSYSSEMYPNGLPKLLYPTWEWFNKFDAERFSNIMDNIKI
jgi:ABC-type Fe3+ transport system substrate-binding protein